MVGDYVAGPNHVLPTGGTARFASALSTEDFVKRMSVIRVLARGLAEAVAPPGRAGRASRDSHGHGAAAARAHRGEWEGAHEARDASVTEPAIPRQGRVERKTKETQIVLQLGIDGAGASKVETGIPFFNHMLEAWAKHGLMDLSVDAKGDLEVDHHHTVEDVGICLGKAFKRGARRQARHRALRRVLPADGRGAAARRRRHLRAAVPRVQRAAPADARSSNFDLDLLKEFFRAFAFNAEITLHVNMHYGENLHHIAEADVQGGGPRARRGHAAQSARSPACRPPRARSSS